MATVGARRRVLRWHPWALRQFDTSSAGRDHRRRGPHQCVAFTCPCTPSSERSERIEGRLPGRQAGARSTAAKSCPSIRSLRSLLGVSGKEWGHGNRIAGHSHPWKKAGHEPSRRRVPAQAAHRAAGRRPAAPRRHGRRAHRDGPAGGVPRRARRARRLARTSPSSAASSPSPTAFLQRPGVRFISGFFGPVERMAIAAGAPIDYLPADFLGWERYARSARAAGAGVGGGADGRARVSSASACMPARLSTSFSRRRAIRERLADRRSRATTCRTCSASASTAAIACTSSEVDCVIESDRHAFVLPEVAITDADRRHRRATSKR